MITPPVLLDHGAAVYPSEGYRVVLNRDALASQLRIEAVEGRVVLKIFVRADGSSGSVEVAESSGTAVLDQAAVRAAAAWKFTPATRDGQPIDAWVMVPMHFVVP